MNVREKITQLFEEGKLAFKTEKQICSALGIKYSESKAAKAVLKALEAVSYTHLTLPTT